MMRSYRSTLLSGPQRSLRPWCSFASACVHPHAQPRHTLEHPVHCTSHGHARSGRGALRGKVRGRTARQINLLCSSLEVAVREAWKQADAKLHQGRSDRCGPDSKVDLYDLIMAPRRPAALEPAGKRARLK